MYDQFWEDTLFCMFYAAVTMLSLNASCYLLFRRANAIAPEVTSPVRLRRWTAVFFASIALSHLWYMPIVFLSSGDDVMLSYLIGVLLDCTAIFPLAIVVLLAFLQDRRRPLWPILVMVIPPIVIIAMCFANHSLAFLLQIRVYLLLLGIGLIIYMVRALRQYGRWLRDNYADLEHKEVWQVFVVLAIILLVFGIYAFADSGSFYRYVLQLIVIVLICYLLWKVETLSDLSIPLAQKLPADETDMRDMEENVLSQTVQDNISALLQQHCINTQLYLQHDLTVAQLARTIGINRFYLSQYFSSLGMSYNVYINNLRVNHFISLYHEAVAANRTFTAQQLAHDSGYQSYSTFSLAFKQRMGQSVTVWMRHTDK